MALQTINLGNLANDGTGDDLRTAFEKVNNNFATLEIAASDITGATNLGVAGATVFKETVNRELKFRRILGQDGINVNESSTAITISATPIPSTIISGDSGSLLYLPGDTININGASNISVSVNNNTKTITISGNLEVLTQNLDAAGYGIENLSTINGVNWDDSIAAFFENMDFGFVQTNITSFIDFIRASNNVDMGTINSPSQFTIDFGPTGSFLN